jgi:hypothetical protein
MLKNNDNTTLKQFESEILTYIQYEFPENYEKSILEHKKEPIKYISSLFNN